MSFDLVESDRHRWLRPRLLTLPGLLAGFTTRQRREPGSFVWTNHWSFRDPAGLEHSAGFQEHVAEILPKGSQTAIERQIHSTRITILENEPGSSSHPHFITPDNDAQLTDRQGLFCLAQSADCCVGLLAIPERRVIGVFHAGWRGAAAGLPRLVISEACRRYSCEPGECLVGLGPTIQQASYQVSRDVFDAVGDPRFFVDDPHAERKFRFDLPGLVRSQLVAAGVPPSQLAVCERDTCAEPAWFHSHRRDGESHGLQVGFIGWTGPTGHV